MAKSVHAEVGGFHANVVQHEYDHLDGILYPMRMTDFRLFGFNEELAKAADSVSAAGAQCRAGCGAGRVPGGAVFDGWTIDGSAAGQQGRMQICCFPGGARDLVEAYCDLMPIGGWRRSKEGRVPDRVRAVIAQRLAAARPYKEAIRRGLAVLAAHPATAAACTARTVDAIWHAAGDRSADFSWYTKRAILTGVYGATLLFWLRTKARMMRTRSPFWIVAWPELARSAGCVAEARGFWRASAPSLQRNGTSQLHRLNGVHYSPALTRTPSMRGLLLWMVGIPIPIIILLYLFGVLH